MTKLLLGCVTCTSIFLTAWHISNLVLSLHHLIVSTWLHLRSNDHIFLGAAWLTSKPRPVILDIEFYSSKFYNITSAQFIILQKEKVGLEIKNCFKNTYQIILSWFCVSNNDKHLIVDILIWNRVSFRISWCFGNKRIIKYLKLTTGLSDDNHRFGISINVLWSCSYRHKLNIIVDSQDLASSLRLDVLLGNVLRLIIEQTMRITWPSHTSHVNFILFLPLLNNLTISSIHQCILTTILQLSFWVSRTFLYFLGYLVTIGPSKLKWWSLSSMYSILKPKCIYWWCIYQTLSYLAGINAVAVHQDLMVIFILVFHTWRLLNVTGFICCSYLFLLPRIVIRVNPAPNILYSYLLLCWYRSRCLSNSSMRCLLWHYCLLGRANIVCPPIWTNWTDLVLSFGLVSPIIHVADVYSLSECFLFEKWLICLSLIELFSQCDGRWD